MKRVLGRAPGIGPARPLVARLIAGGPGTRLASDFELPAVVFRVWAVERDAGRGWVTDREHGVLGALVVTRKPLREVERRAGPSLALAVDEVFTLVAENGKPLLEIVGNASGPVVRLLCGDTQLELPGKLRIAAADIELTARRGSVRIESDDDVVVQGEMVRLN